MTYYIKDVYQVGTTLYNKYRDTSTVSLNIADGSLATPSFSFNGDPQLGLYCENVGDMCVTSGGKRVGKFNKSGFVAPTYTTIERDALTGMSGGEQIFNISTGRPNFYDGTIWVAL